MSLEFEVLEEERAEDKKKDEKRFKSVIVPNESYKWEFL